ncbi:MAG: RNA polymerase ECF-type sigma factor, partial [uncultured Rubrobacteraceae bacterium]
GRSGRRDPGAARGGGGRARPGRPLRPLRGPDLRRRDPLPWGPGAGRRPGTGRLSGRVEKRGPLRPLAGELLDLGLPHNPQPGDRPDPAPQGPRADGGWGPADGARGPGPIRHPLPRLRRGRRAYAALPDPSGSARPRVLRGTLPEGDLHPHRHPARHGQEPHHRRDAGTSRGAVAGFGRMV